MSVTTGTFPGVRIVDMPDLGPFNSASSLVGERAGSGRFSATGLTNYLTTVYLPLAGGTVTGLANFYETDWLTPMINWPSGATLGIYAATNGGIAITGGSHTSGAPPGDGAIGVSGFGFNDKVPSGGGSEAAWGGYFEARYYPGVTNNTFAVEIDIANVSGVPAAYTSAYTAAAPFSTALLLGSGAGVSADTPALTASPASAAIWITDNEAPFVIGIGFKSTSLLGTNGNDSGTGVALSLAKGHQILWSKPDGTPGPAISSTHTTGAPTNLTFGNGGAELDGSLSINNAAGNNRLVIGSTNNSARWAMALGNSTGETGGNAGSDFQLDAHDDGGTYLKTVMIVNRATGVVQFSGLRGTTTNDNAGAGQVGEYVTASVAYTSPVTCPSAGTAINVTSVSLTAGDWDVSGAVWFGGSSANVTSVSGWVNTASAAPPAQGLPGYFVQQFQTSAYMIMPAQFTVGTVRLSLAATTTVYLGAIAASSSGSVAAAGTIRARRVR
jgi:hypothetical protein